MTMAVGSIAHTKQPGLWYCWHTAGVLLAYCWHTVGILRYCYILSYNCHTATLLYYRTVKLLYYHTVILLSCCHNTAMVSYSDILLAYCWHGILPYYCLLYAVIHIVVPLIPSNTHPKQAILYIIKYPIYYGFQ